MGLESFIHFIVQHNETIIQWLVLAVVLLAALVVGISIFRPSKHVDLESEELTQVLKKVAESGGLGAVAGSGGLAGAGVAGLSAAGGAGAGAGGAGGADMQLYKQELEAKAKEIAALKLEMDAAKSSGEDAEHYKKKIKELEGKLAEYEILEDDIADLSLFKEENARLKAELKQMGRDISGGGGAGGSGGAGGGGSAGDAGGDVSGGLAGSASDAADAAGAGAAAGAAAGAGSGAAADGAAGASGAGVDDLSAALAEAVNSASTEPPKDDLINEFKAAMDAQQAPEPQVQHGLTSDGDSDDAGGGAVATGAVAAGAGTADDEASAADSTADDLLSEFAASLEGSMGFDTKKMIAEVEDLKSVEPASGNALEDDADIDKMVEEASKLKGG